MENIRIVLVNTSHPGNIGAVARAMKNMGLSQLCLVSPKYFPHADAIARASGADGILEKAQVVDTLDDALVGCGLVLATSARTRTLPWPLMNPREAAEKVFEDSQHTQVAIVFGREHSGLSNAELEKCHYHIHISTNPDFPSLNLAAAVQVIVYELRMTFMKPEASKESLQDVDLATADEMESFYQHLQTVMISSGFLNPKQPKKLLQRLRRLFNRARVEKPELNILRGILTAVQKND